MILFAMLAAASKVKVEEPKVPVTLQDTGLYGTFESEKCPQGWALADGKNGTVDTRPLVKTKYVTCVKIAASGIYFNPVNYTEKQREKLMSARIKLNEVIHSPCMTDFFTNTKKRSKLLRTNGRTREEVLDHIRSLDMLLPVKMYKKNNNVIGYRNKGSDTVYTNSKYHNSFSACSVASNLGHEALHVAGYTHDSKRTKDRPFSVPYTFSSAINLCCK